ncbi:helix-turn-helix domain-containing protein [Carboxylicivirga sp. RSCT41]|uniref:helix-turn-helix domain-containing protein n=1 Tax=Carboxylicivirga agarovorans TaxID=3417570 RepID=UPI003D327656
MPKNNIGQRIKKERIRKGLTQEEVAKEIGISQVGYGKIERGETDKISLKVAKQISEKLELNYMDFFGVEDYVRIQEEDRIMAKEYFLDNFMENLDFIRLSVFQLLGAFASNPKIKPLPSNSLFGSTGYQDDKNALIEFKWTLLKKSGVFSEDDLAQFLDSEEGYVFPELKDWFENNRFDLTKASIIIPEDQYKKLGFYGIFNDCTPAELFGKPIKKK